MKIAIFGDSWADPCDWTIEPISWTKLLTKKDKNYKITNFAKSGTSLWWSYELFLKNYKNFDVIIFVCTSVGRLSRLISGHGVNSERTAIQKLQQETDPQTIKLLNSAIDYYIHFQNYDQEVFLYKKIMEELVQFNSNRLIIVPAFQISIEYQTIFKNFLFEITKKDLKVNFGSSEIKFETINRANHMSKENNEILAEKIHQIIQFECDSISIDDFVFQKYDNPEKYWEI